MPKTPSLPLRQPPGEPRDLALHQYCREVLDRWLAAETDEERAIVEATDRRWAG